MLTEAGLEASSIGTRAGWPCARAVRGERRVEGEG